MVRDLPRVRKSIFRKPKSQRCTQAARANRASANFSQAQPLTGARDGRSLRAASDDIANHDNARTSADALMRSTRLRIDVLAKRGEQCRDGRIRQRVEQRTVSGEIGTGRI